jgi:hypothetical protein
MTRAKVVLVAVMTVPLAGCVLSGQPKTVAAGPPPPQPTATAPPPEPLSIPQTHVDLPPPQPVDPDALKPEQHVDQTPPAPAKPPAPVQRPQHASGPPAASSKPADPAPPPAAEPEQPARPPIQEILSPDAEKQLRDSAHKHEADTLLLVKGVKPKTENQKRTKAEIDQFLKQSEDAEAAGDMRKADQLAERAFVLAKELQSGK